MEKNNIFYRLLSSPYFYSLSQKVMSATSFRKKIVTNFIKKKNSYVLDIGCGPAEILENFDNIFYYGFDTNKYYIEHAKQKYNFKSNFFCHKFNAKKIKNKIKFDYVLLLGLLHHLNDKESDVLLAEIKKVLKKKGMLLTLDNVYTRNQNFVAKKLIDFDRGNHVRTKKEYLSILKKNFKVVNSNIYHQKFIPYTWFVTRSLV
jgi:SAM-dependent methyltransferase